MTKGSVYPWDRQALFKYQELTILFWNATIDFYDYLLKRMKDIIKEKEQMEKKSILR